MKRAEWKSERVNVKTRDRFRNLLDLYDFLFFWGRKKAAFIQELDAPTPLSGMSAPTSTTTALQLRLALLSPRQLE